MSAKTANKTVKTLRERVNPFLIRKTVPTAKAEGGSVQQQKPAEVVGELRPVSKKDLQQLISRLPTVCLVKQSLQRTPVSPSDSSDELEYMIEEPIDLPRVSTAEVRAAGVPVPVHLRTSNATTNTTLRVEPPVTTPPEDEESKESKLIKIVASPVKESESSVEAVKELMESGANVNHQVDDGTTPLILAVKRKHLRTAQLLIDRGADINLADKQERTPLNWAVHRENEEMVHLLLRNNADPIIKNSKGETCFYTALNERCKKMQELLAYSQVSCWRPGLPLSHLSTSDYKRNKFFSFVKSEVTKSVEENGMPDTEVQRILKDSEIHTPAIQARLLEGLAWDEEVHSALESLDLEKYSEMFAKHRVTFRDFISLTERDLIEIGVCSLASLEKILTLTQSYKT